MDVLSDVLRVVKLEGALFFNAEFSAPWSLKSSSSVVLAPFLAAEGKQLIIYHFLTEGRAYAKLTNGQRVDLAAGEVVVLPHGSAHFLGNGTGAKPLDAVKSFGQNLSQGLKLARFGGGGETTKFVCGYMTCEPSLSEIFLSGLPPIFKIRIVRGLADEWLASSIRFSVDELNGTDAGSDLVVEKLAELVFVETLRRYINDLPTDAVGWLAGTRDASIGHALALLHKEPDRDWTISELARQVGLSRTRLAARFNHFLGDSPISYLAQWRLKLGAQMLGSTDHSVAEVAIAVGYGSEAAFNRAFKREFEIPPAQFRRQRKAVSR